MIDCWTTGGGSRWTQGGSIFAVPHLAVCRVTDCFRRGHCVVSQEAGVIETISVPSSLCRAGIYHLVLVLVRDMEKEKESCSESVVLFCYMKFMLPFSPIHDFNRNPMRLALDHSSRIQYQSGRTMQYIIHFVCIEIDVLVGSSIYNTRENRMIQNDTSCFCSMTVEIS